MTVPNFLRSEPDLTASLHPFRERLAETVSWCSRRAALEDLAAALRTASLSPPPAVGWPETVRSVAEARLAALGRSWRRSQDPLGGGRLLLYFPTPPHSRGAARTASNGYFDQRDTPPWDTWAAYMEETGRSYLVAWVPPQALTPATAGVTAAPNSLAWLDHADVGFRPPSHV